MRSTRWLPSLLFVVLVCAASGACGSSEEETPFSNPMGSAGTGGTAGASGSTGKSGAAGSGTSGSGTSGSGTAGAGTAGSGTSGAATSGAAGATSGASGASAGKSGGPSCDLTKTVQCVGAKPFGDCPACYPDGAEGCCSSSFQEPCGKKVNGQCLPQPVQWCNGICSAPECCSPSGQCGACPTGQGGAAGFGGSTAFGGGAGDPFGGASGAGGMSGPGAGGMGM